jgi:hypothetical protein
MKITINRKIYPLISINSNLSFIRKGKKVYLVDLKKRLISANGYNSLTRALGYCVSFTKNNFTFTK